MKTPPAHDPRREPAALSDDALLAAHTQPVAEKTKAEDSARFRILPLVLVFVFSGLVLASATYLNRYSGRFSASIYDENGKPGGSTASAPKALDPVALGKRQFQAACITCHQANGLGIPGAFPPLAGSEWANGNEERVIRIVLHGLSGEVKVGPATFNGVMPSFGKVPGGGFNWRDDQIAEVLTYIRQEWGNKAGSVTPEQVTAIRTQEAARAKPWTAAELMAIGH
ncbi:MAG TPA: cytochrome c [Opitutaceae bacterium]|nr:cytochrome c [Opitutaceae bacterium]